MVSLSSSLLRGLCDGGGVSEEHADPVLAKGHRLGLLADRWLHWRPGGNCIKIGLPGKLILRDCFQVNMTSRRPFLFDNQAWESRREG